MYDCASQVFADIALCPFEMTKVRMQVTLPGDAGSVPKSLLPAFSALYANRAETKFPFGSLYPLWGRQGAFVLCVRALRFALPHPLWARRIVCVWRRAFASTALAQSQCFIPDSLVRCPRAVPYTMIKFVGFYVTAEYVYEQLEKRFNLKKSDMSTSSQLMVTFASGYWAGIFCAIATQPMDNLVSMKGIAANKDKTWGQLATEMGTKDLFLKGLSTRVIMIGTLTGLQWYIYGQYKSLVGLGTS